MAARGTAPGIWIILELLPFVPVPSSPLLSNPFSSLFRRRGLRRSPLNPARRSGERCKLPQQGFGAKPQLPSILVHFEHLQMLLITRALFHAHDLTFHAYPCLNWAQNFSCISSRKKLPHPFRRPSLLAPGCICPLPFPTRRHCMHVCVYGVESKTEMNGDTIGTCSQCSRRNSVTVSQFCKADIGLSSYILFTNT